MKKHTLKIGQPLKQRSINKGAWVTMAFTFVAQKDGQAACSRLCR